jgi:putative membrane protein
MMRRTGRLLLLLVAALVVGLLATGSFALAQNNGGDHHRSDQRQRSDGQSSDQKLRRCDQVCREKGYSAWDQQWLMMSIEGDRFEIQGGMLAQHRATTQIVRDLGARLVKDHTKSLEDAIAVAEKLGIDVPKEPSPSQQWELRAVAQFPGRAFDRWYSDLEVQDHVQDITEAQDEVDQGFNEKVKSTAEDDLPVLREHLRLAQAALASVDGNASSSSR